MNLRLEARGSWARGSKYKARGSKARGSRARRLETLELSCQTLNSGVTLIFSNKRGLEVY